MEDSGQTINAALARRTRQLQASEERFRVLLDQNVDGILVVDQEGIVRFANPAAGALFGRGRGELVGCPFGWPMITGDRTEVDILRPGGEQGIAEMRVVDTEWEGKQVWLASLRDITERKRMETALRESELRTRTVLNAAVDGILTIQETGAIETFNPACERLFGCATADVVGRDLRTLVMAPPGDDFDALLERYLLAGAVNTPRFGREVIGVRPDGTTFPLYLALSEMPMGDRRLFMGILRDLTDHHYLREQLVQAQKMESVGRLAGGVAHDFNNYLTAIMGYAELAQMRLASSSSPELSIESIRQAAAAAAGLTGRLLTFARRQRIEARELDLNRTVASMQGMLERMVGEDIELSVVLEPGLGAIKADPGQVEQVLVNLAVNARDAMPHGGQLRLATASAVVDRDYARRHPELPVGEYILLTVSDTGHGMTAEVRRQAFEPFFTTKGPGRGTGLGLSICYGIVKQSGGHIAINSEPGKGATFRIYLPRVAPGASAPARPGVAARRAPGTETILLVEDDDLVRSVAEETLRAQGYTVLTASDGLIALQVAAAWTARIHLLLTDVVMPTMSGREVAERIRQARSDITVLYMSGYTDDRVLRHGVRENTIAFLPKPFTPATLVARVREVLDGS